MKPAIEQHLAAAPAAVRARMLAADRLAPGAAAVVGRLYAVLADRGEPADMPSRASFDAAATSEATLATLLRTLEIHAPGVCLAAGREARKAWYARRPKSGGARRRGRAPLPPEAPLAWPVEWALLYPRLLAAPIRESSRRRYVDSVNQLAAILPKHVAPDWSRYTACSLFEALAARGETPRTICTYLDGLIGLGLHGRIGDARLAGLREMRNVASVRASRVDKKKVARIADLTERGGFEAIATAIGRLRSDAEGLPPWSAAAERLRRAAAILAVEINAYGRTGDVASWRLGTDLVREPWGTWRLGWQQGKTTNDQDVGELWPEVGEVLDELILGGRPRRFAGLRYQELAGRNWLTHTQHGLASRHPSELVNEAIGVPLHDLRTLVADMLRRTDPSRGTRPDRRDPRACQHRGRGRVQHRMRGRLGDAAVAGRPGEDRDGRIAGIGRRRPAEEVVGKSAANPFRPRGIEPTSSSPERRPARCPERRPGPTRSTAGSFPSATSCACC